MATAFLCSINDLADPGSKGMTVHCGDDLVDIFLVRQGAQVSGFINSCPHTGAPLDWVPDRFLSLDSKHIQCASHDALFRMQDGVCIAGPCAGDALTPVPLARAGDDVLLLEDEFCAARAAGS